MKSVVFWLAVFAVGVSAAIGIENAKRPGEFKAYADQAEQVARRAWEGVAANPLPAALALGTFLLTVVYHKAKGKSLRESVEMAATRVTVVPVPAPAAAAEDETPVVKRAKARATRSQLLADQVGLQNRLRKLPEEVAKAEKDVCYTQQAVTDAKRVLGDRHKAHNVTVAKLSALRNEKAAGEEELAAIEAELKKLAVLV